MLYSTLHAAQLSVRCTFTKALADRHHFVRTVNGGWCLTLDAPGLLPEQAADGLKLMNVRGRVWHQSRG